MGEYGEPRSSTDDLVQEERTPVTGAPRSGAAVADVLGRSGVYVDPVWRIAVTLTPLEQELLRTRWVRRLAFVAHAGASTIATTQSYSRLEHSLGLLALVAHFAPDDRAARVTALLHDIGHLPFSHTLEGLAGLEHHELGRARIRDLSAVLGRGGIDDGEVLAIDRGERPSVLHNAEGVLRLDHLESFVRSGRSHGRTTEPPPTTLRHLRVVDGGVDTDPRTAAYLGDLVVAEAVAHLSEPNVVANAVLRRLVATLIEDASPERVLGLAELTDDLLWATLLGDPRTAALAQDLRDDPTRWETARRGTDGPPEPGALSHTVHRLYLDLPRIDGKQQHVGPSAVPDTPVEYVVRLRG